MLGQPESLNDHKGTTVEKHAVAGTGAEKDV